MAFIYVITVFSTVHVLKTLWKPVNIKSSSSLINYYMHGVNFNATLDSW